MTTDRPYPNGGPSSQSSLPQPHASSSRLQPLGNPQLGPNPFFAYPTPKPEEVEEELPPVFEGDNVPLGALLNRVVRRGYGELRGLTESTLPSLSDRQKPQPIIAYSRSTRQSILKYLAVLRWKSQVDVPVYAALTGAATSPQRNIINGHAATSFPTPHSSNGSTDSPGGYIGKGKGKATDDQGERVVVRGKVTDAKRIEVFMAHQNAQHSAAIEHLRHTSKVVDGLRLRNPDLLTAMSVLSLGTYSRLPPSLTETFLPKPPLTNTLIIHTLRRLNRHIRYRLKCIDYVPTDLIILEVKDGRVYIEGSNGQWRAELTIINFGTPNSTKTEEGKRDRWWLTGVEWGWREKNRQKGIVDPGGTNRRLEGEERKAVLDLANMEILPWRDIDIPDSSIQEVKRGLVARRAIGLGDDNSMAGSPSVAVESKVKEEGKNLGKKVDAPFVRIYNFLQHLCLTYQLEVLYTQAMTLAGGSRRGQLSVELDRTKKTLILRYWLRTRPTAPPAPAQPASKRPNQPPIPDSRQPLVGGTLTISLIEDPTPRDQADSLLAEIQGDGSTPTERLLRLKLGVKWQVGDSGEGAGWKFGDVLDSSNLIINPSELSISDLIDTATSNHAAHLTRHHCTPLLSLSRLSIFPSNPPTLLESTADSARPLSLRVPLPGRQKSTCLLVIVSSLTGLIEIVDEGAVVNFEVDKGKGAMEDRGKRAKMASGSVNEGKSRLGDDIGRLITAIITENVEFQMKALGYNPVRKLPMRPQDIAKADLHAASTIFLTLPTSQSQHHLITKVTSLGIIFEVIQLIRVPTENGTGMKLIIGERVSVDRERIKGGMRVGKRKRGEAGDESKEVKKRDEGGSAFILESKELRDMFIYSNALVAQSIIESQLKSRSIPYTLQLPPSSGPGAPNSRSAIAGLVPTFVVNSADLLRDGKASDVAMPKVYIQVKNWWGGGKCTAVTVVQIRHRPSTVSSSVQPKSSKAAKDDGITFDQSSSVVKFDSGDLDHCVGGFLEQWERLSKVIIVSGTVNKLNKIPSFKDVKMLSFDLRTASLEYSPGYICSITYDSTTDGYVVSFGKRTIGTGKGMTPGSTSGQTPGATIGDEAGNPHTAMSGLLSWELNELVENGKDVGIRFIGLLRATLPFLLEVESITNTSASPKPSSSKTPQLVILTTRRYRLIWDTPESRSGLDITLLPNNQGWIISDSGSSDSSKYGRMRAISGFKEITGRIWDQIRFGGDGLSPESERDVKMENSPDSMATKEARKGAEVAAVKLDEGESLMISAKADGVVALAVRMFVKEISGDMG